MAINVIQMFHPTLRVPDLRDAERFVTDFFGRTSVRTKDAPSSKKVQAYEPTYPTDYAIFTSIAEVVLDCLDPARFVIGGKQLYPAVTEGYLAELGWYVDGVAELFDAMTAAGIRHVRQHGSDPDVVPPRAAFADLILYWADARDVGLRYELYDPRGGLIDPRKKQGWTPEANLVDGVDPLGLVRCAHHTVLTRDRGRALRFVVDLLGGRIVHEGAGSLPGSSSVYVALADGVLEYATPAPDGEGAASLDRSAPQDWYHALTWQVEDLDRVRTHVRRLGIPLVRDEPERVVVDPDAALGVPWGFVTAPVPGDPRVG